MEHWIAGATHPDDCYDVLDWEAESQRGDDHARDDHDAGDFLEISILIFFLGHKAEKFVLLLPEESEKNSNCAHQCLFSIAVKYSI